MKRLVVVAAATAVLIAGFVSSGKPPNGKPPSDVMERAKRQVRLMEDTSEYRLIGHVFGQTKVPRSPRRVACLTASNAGNVLALGIQPVLVLVQAQDDYGPLPYADRLAGVPVLRRGEAINLEAVLAAKPDLIFAHASSDSRWFDQLSQIAPTVAIAAKEDNVDSREAILLDFGEALGIPERAKQRVAEYRDRVSRARETLAEAAQGQPVVFIRFRERRCEILNQTTATGLLLFHDLGLTPDPLMSAVQVPYKHWDVISAEHLPRLCAEHVFVVVHANSEWYFRKIVRTPLWQSIPAVQHGRVHRVAHAQWLLEVSVLQSESVIDEVLAVFQPKGRS